VADLIIFTASCYVTHVTYPATDQVTIHSKIEEGFILFLVKFL
jgi:hypothetical protein